MDVKKILIVHYGYFGDSLLLCPFLRALKQNFSAARIVCILGRGRKIFDHPSKLFRNNPYLDQCLDADRVKLGSRIFKDKYDLVFDFTADRNLNLILEGCWKRLKITSDFRRNEVFIKGTRLGIASGRRFFGRRLKKNIPRQKRFQLIGELSGMAVKKWELPQIYLSSKELNFGRDFIKKNIPGNHKKIIIVHPGGINPFRLWEARNYSVLLDRLAGELQAGLAVLYGPQEDYYARQVIRLSRSKPALIFKKNIRQYLSIVSAGDVFIGSEGGPLHMALSLNKKVVGIFRYKEIFRHWYSDYGNSGLLSAVFVSSKFNPMAENKKGFTPNHKEINKVYEIVRALHK